MREALCDMVVKWVLILVCISYSYEIKQKMFVEYEVMLNRSVEFIYVIVQMFKQLED